MRRSKIQREADFFGAMDGASKFVKGDAIMSLVVTFINLVGGIVIGFVTNVGLDNFRLIVSKGESGELLPRLGLFTLMLAVLTGLAVAAIREFGGRRRTR